MTNERREVKLTLYRSSSSHTPTFPVFLIVLKLRRLTHTCCRPMRNARSTEQLILLRTCSTLPFCEHGVAHHRWRFFSVIKITLSMSLNDNLVSYKARSALQMFDLHTDHCREMTRLDSVLIGIFLAGAAVQITSRRVWRARFDIVRDFLFRENQVNQSEKENG